MSREGGYGMTEERRRIMYLGTIPAEQNTESGGSQERREGIAAIVLIKRRNPPPRES